MSKMIEQRGIYLRLPEKIIVQLDLEANKLGVPRASIIKRILHEGLKND